jgi:hypothetical protein
MANALGELKHSTGPWMAAAIILVAGFMFWLYAASSDIERGVVAADTTMELPVIAETAFVADPTQFSRQRIMLSPVTVGEILGRSAFTTELPGIAGYPMILDQSALQMNLGFIEGDNLAVAGQVYALNDSLLNVYVQRGFFEPEHREKLEGHTTFFLVDSLDFVFPEEETAREVSGS